MAHLDVSVIIPSRGAPPGLSALLSALGGQTLRPARYEILIVDPAMDGGFRRLEELAQRWDGPALRILRGPAAGGPAARRNHGARNAKGRVLAFTDTDCEPESGWLEAGLAAVRAGARLVQGATYPPDGAPVPQHAHHLAIERESGLFEACNMFYEGELFESLGGFTSRYFRRYLRPFGEDVELGWRARRAGAAYRFEPTAVVRHDVVPHSLSEHLRYQWGGRGFPLLVRDMPELRSTTLYRRLFLSRRSAEFLAATGGVALASRHRAAAALAAPYLRRLAGETPRSSPAAGAGHAARAVLSDGVLLAGLVFGSIRWRRLVL